MKELVIEPDGWPCRLDECRPGLFVCDGALVALSEYGQNPEGYLASSGEFFAGGVGTQDERNALMVQPVRAVWRDADPG
jgi:hypothetical protein